MSITAKSPFAALIAIAFGNAGVLLPVAAGIVCTMDSPNARNTISLLLESDGSLRYTVSRDGNTVIPASPLGLTCSDQEFRTGLSVETVGEQKQHIEKYELFAGIRPNIEQLHNRRSVVFANGADGLVIIDLDAADEGVAFRYRFAGSDNRQRTVLEEHTGFSISPDAEGWLQPYNRSGKSSPAYEDYYFRMKPGTPPPKSRGGKTRGWYLPALFHLPRHRTWALIAESGTNGAYCGCHLGSEAPNCVYTIEFPFEDETTAGVGLTGSTAPKHSLPWAMPWRVIILGDDAGKILTSTLITDLAAPSKILKTDWIRPGRASWSWWGHPRGPNTRELYGEYITMSAAYGWEYSLLDAGWWKCDTAAVISKAEEAEVSCMLWTHAREFYAAEEREAKLDRFKELGACGAKIDFWCSDRQETMAAIHATLEAAARRNLFINLHGCSMPRGWHRTWPNLITAEAVLGAESYMFDKRYPDKSAELNTILPFIRNVSGPMDYTPVGLSMKRHRRKNTAAHELAASIIFTSGIVHYADKPGVYGEFSAETREILRDASARWQETRCLIGEPGRAVVLARKNNTGWFIAGINGTEDQIPVKLDFSVFPNCSRRIIASEDDNPLMQIKTARVASSVETWNHTMPPRGGFVLRLFPE